MLLKEQNVVIIKNISEIVIFIASIWNMEYKAC